MLRSLLSRAEKKVISLLGEHRILPIQLDITNACNLTCVHCYHPDHKNTGAIGLDEWFQIIQEYEELCSRLGYLREIIICGGEPLISQHLEPILNYFSKQPPNRIWVLTNGTVFKPEFRHYPDEFKEKITFQVSLDGPQAELHDLIRGEGSFAKSLRGIELFQSLGYKIDLLAVLSQRNYPYIEGFFELAKTLGVNFMGFTRLISVGTASTLVASGDDRPLEPLQLKDAYERILKASLKYQIKSNSRSPLMHLIHPALGVKPRFAEAIIVNYKGEMIASSRTGLVLGNVLSEGLEEIFLNHPINRALRAGKIAICGECPDYAICGGDRSAAYAATGDFLGHDPGCWKVNQKEGKTYYETAT